MNSVSFSDIHELIDYRVLFLGRRRFHMRGDERYECLGEDQRNAERDTDRDRYILQVYGHLVIQDGYLINLIPIEIYVTGVLNGEVPSSWPSEVLKAQAVVSRTYAQLRIKQYDDKLFHAGSSELFQKYDYTQTNDAIERAVRDSTVRSGPAQT